MVVIAVKMVESFVNFSCKSGFNFSHLHNMVLSGLFSRFYSFHDRFPNWNLQKEAVILLFLSVQSTGKHRVQNMPKHAGFYWVPILQICLLLKLWGFFLHKDF